MVFPPAFVFNLYACLFFCGNGGQMLPTKSQKPFTTTGGHITSSIFFISNNYVR